MLTTIRRDIQSVFARDPAARSLLEVLTCYPGLHAVWGYRVAHWFWIHNLKLVGRILSQVVRSLTGIEIHPGAKILGAITGGECRRVGANAVVVRSVPPDSVVVGVPGEIVTRSRPHPDVHTPDLEHSQMPDVVGDMLQELMERGNQREGRV